MYAMSVVVESPNNMEFLYGGFDDLQYTYQGKQITHKNTRTTHTHAHTKHAHRLYTHTHIHTCTYHTYILHYIYHNHNWHIHACGSVGSGNTGAISPAEWLISATGGTSPWVCKIHERQKRWSTLLSDSISIHPAWPQMGLLSVPWSLHVFCDSCSRIRMLLYSKALYYLNHFLNTLYIYIYIC